MQIVVKAAKNQDKDPLDVITSSVAETLGSRDKQAVVSKVFPAQTTGHRARLYTVELPDDLPAKDLNRVVERLSRQEAFEYAELPAAKRPLIP
ncbi:MAG: hypothetical protein ACJ76J_13910 [Thermoanaerobaculia bacterium]